ncbi:MAG TPA: hypothetical protein VNO82_08215, partial [Solirubrobacteraceae bacterium]|nr:hypothetical protein [Solirubrobacteraceae bacterium]
MIVRIVALAVLLAALPATATAEPALRVDSLTTEHAERPLGIDETAPRLGWTLKSGRRDQAQRAYQVRVSSGGRTVWDSGRVESSRTFDVPYDGEAL